jgi:hypothetical protein
MRPRQELNFMIMRRSIFRHVSFFIKPREEDWGRGENSLACVTCDHTNEQDEFTSHLLVDVLLNLLVRGQRQGTCRRRLQASSSAMWAYGSNALMFWADGWIFLWMNRSLAMDWRSDGLWLIGDRFPGAAAMDWRAFLLVIDSLSIGEWWFRQQRWTKAATLPRQSPSRTHPTTGLFIGGCPMSLCTRLCKSWERSWVSCSITRPWTSYTSTERTADGWAMPCMGFGHIFVN